MYNYLRELGVTEQNARNLVGSGKGWWRLSLTPVVNIAMSNAWFENMGLVNLEKKVTSYNFN
jgi:hypothetical protein